MSNTTAVYARIDTELKNNAEEILSKLGITPSVAIQMLYSQIILTGGIAHGEQVTNDIKDRVGFIAPVTVYPGEDELLALAQGALRVMNGEEEARIYN